MAEAEGYSWHVHAGWCCPLAFSSGAGSLLAT